MLDRLPFDCFNLVTNYLDGYSVYKTINACKTLKAHRVEIAIPAFSLMRLTYNKDESVKYINKQLNLGYKLSLIEHHPFVQSDLETYNLGKFNNVDLMGSNIADISALCISCSRLQRLNLAHNKKLVDVSALAALVELRELNLAHTKVEDASMLGHLWILILSYTRVIDVSALGNVHKLELIFTRVIDVSALGRVHTLNLSSTAVNDVSALGGVNTLILSCCSWVVNVDALKTVLRLDLSNTEVTDVSALGDVLELNLYQSKVIDVSQLGRVKKLNLSHTRVTDVSALVNVPDLNLQCTAISAFSNALVGPCYICA